ncbi:MAG: 2Fe-2S ferredoxin [Alkalinema sp. CACIAM 70d]|nr:MAG: 2Fe-2S ferredoxin [Alkalinema sp. CACIAM 70d]
MTIPLRQVLVCQYRNCMARGAAELLDQWQARSVPENVQVEASGCLGQCNLGPSMQILPDQVWYCEVKPQHIEQIIEQHLRNNQPVSSLLNPRFHFDWSRLQES